MHSGSSIKSHRQMLHKTFAEKNRSCCNEKCIDNKHEMKTSNSRRHDSRRYVQELTYATGTNMHTKLQERQLLIGNKYSAPRRYGQNSNMHALEWHSGRESSCHWKSGITIAGIIIAFHNSGRTWSVMQNYDMSKYYLKKTNYKAA